MHDTTYCTHRTTSVVNPLSFVVDTENHDRSGRGYDEVTSHTWESNNDLERSFREFDCFAFLVKPLRTLRFSALISQFPSKMDLFRSSSVPLFQQASNLVWDIDSTMFSLFCNKYFDILWYRTNIILYNTLRCGTYFLGLGFTRWQPLFFFSSPRSFKASQLSHHRFSHHSQCIVIIVFS